MLQTACLNLWLSKMLIIFKVNKLFLQLLLYTKKPIILTEYRCKNLGTLPKWIRQSTQQQQGHNADAGYLQFILSPPRHRRTAQPGLGFQTFNQIILSFQSIFLHKILERFQNDLIWEGKTLRQRTVRIACNSLNMLWTTHKRRGNL